VTPYSPSYDTAKSINVTNKEKIIAAKLSANIIWQTKVLSARYFP
jgi:hypothetical protein